MRRWRTLVVLLCALFLITACGEAEEDSSEKRKKKHKETEESVNSEDSPEEEQMVEEPEEEEEPSADDAPSAEEESTEEEEPTAADTPSEDNMLNSITVVFERNYDVSGYECGSILGIAENGEVIWEYQTGEYPIAQLDQTEEIGLYNGMYYFCEDGAIIAFHPQTGEIIWKNESFYGAGVCYDFDEQGNLYIAGYFGPDLMIIDKNGRTVDKFQALSDDVYLWPYKLDYAQEHVFITYEHYDSWNWAERPFWENGGEPQYGGYTRSYSLQDGSIDTEYNAIESEPQYHCYYQENQGQSLQIDYLGENVYLVNVLVEGTVCATNLIGYLEGDKISFSGANETYDYAGTVYKEQGGMVVKFHETNNGQLILGKEYLFGVDRMPDSETKEPETLTPDELMARITEITATSSLSEYDMTHTPAYVVDGDLTTGWVEGADGQGIGEIITISFNQETPVNGIFIYAGYQKSDSLFEKNSRPKDIVVSFSDGTGEGFGLHDLNDIQQIVFSSTKVTTSISIEIRSVYPGSKYEDTVISELVLY